MKSILKQNFKLMAVLFFITAATFLKAQCTANFSYTLNPSGNVSFISTSVGTSSNASYYWYFGDNTSFNTTGNPAATHTYSNNQTYSVTLWVSDSITTPGCYASVTKTLIVNNASCLGNASFTSNQGANGAVYFYDLSNTASGSSYNWAFGDGGTSVTASPTHTYATSGVYNVTLTVTTPSAICTYSTIQSLTVNIVPCNLNASFTYTAGANAIVNFSSTATNTSVNTYYYWNFGDGNYGYGSTVTHSYTSNNIFNVQHTVVDSVTFVYCSDTTSQAVNISNAPCIANASFTMAKDSTQLPAIVWNAYVSYPANVVSATWNWGDGSSSTGLFPSHTYSTAGMYNVCLTVSVSCGASTVICVNSNINKTTANNAMITLNVVSATPTGMKQNELNGSSVKLYPNPNNGEFEILLSGLSEKNATVKVYDVTGREVFSSDEEQANGILRAKLNLSMLNSGSYFVKINSGNLVYNSKLVITK